MSEESRIKNYNTDYLREKIGRLKKDNDIAYRFNTFLILLSVIAIIAAVVNYKNAKFYKSFYTSQIKQYEFFVENFKASKEYKAIEKCQSEDFWKAECIAYELNERKDK